MLKEIFTNIFKQSKLLRTEFSESLISSLYDHAEEKHIPVDEYLFKEGETSSKLFLILKGEGEITIHI